MKQVYLRLIDGTTKRMLADVEIMKDSIKFIRADGGGETIYKQYIEKMEIEEATGNETIGALGSYPRTRILPEEMSAPRYNVYGDIGGYGEN